MCTVQEAIGQQVGEIEEVAYAGARDDPKAAMQWLGIRAHKTWGKKTEVAVTVETHPIKQIVMHSTTQQIEDRFPIEAEFTDE